MPCTPVFALLAVLLCGACADARGTVPVASAPSAVATPSVGPSPTPSPTVRPAPVVVAEGDGELAVVAGGSSRVGRGPLRTYVVEVEGGLGLDPAQVAMAVDRVLADPRSWTSGGRQAVQRVDDPDEADLRIAIASPATTDRLCAPMRTVGRYSCANGERAVLNARRWLTGAAAYGGQLEAYRTYLVNHEVGHVLGRRHASCPGAGQVAPVMLQQTKGLDGCVTGPWPFPQG